MSHPIETLPERGDRVKELRFTDARDYATIYFESGSHITLPIHPEPQSERAQMPPQDVGSISDPLRDHDSIGEVLECLNSAFRADPVALACLLANRVPCNNALEHHPFVTVSGEHVPAGSSEATLGVLGLINGVLMALFGKKIVVQYGDSPDFPLQGFRGFPEHERESK